MMYGDELYFVDWWSWGLFWEIDAPGSSTVEGQVIMFRVEDFYQNFVSVLVRFGKILPRVFAAVASLVLSPHLCCARCAHDRVTLDHKNTKLPLGDFPKEALGVKSDRPKQDGSRNSNQYMRMQDAKEQGDLISVLKSTDSNNLQRKSINLNSKTPNTTAFSLKPIRYLQWQNLLRSHLFDSTPVLSRPTESHTSIKRHPETSPPRKRLLPLICFWFWKISINDKL